MQSILIVGSILMIGFMCGEIAARIKFPKVTGYILAGIILNPGLSGLIPQQFVEHTGLITNIALAFITFSVGGTIVFSKIKKLGRPIFYITIFESELAFLWVALGLLITLPFLVRVVSAGWASTFIPISLLLGALASPTDPSATLAVSHQYQAKGDVTSTIMGAAAFDDALGIINYSIAVIIASSLIAHKTFDLSGIVLKPLLVIFGAVFLGTVFGLIFNRISLFIDRETEGVYIVVILGLLSLCFGLALFFGVDELLSTMTMGVIVTNLNRHREKIFRILERYTDELIFILFFTLSGMYLDFSLFVKNILLVLCFIGFRTIGKISGVYTGANIAGAKPEVRRYTAWGLIPQGGIVVGLALVMKQNPDFSEISGVIISVIIGATIVHELIGPVCAKAALKKAGEIKF